MNKNKLKIGDEVKCIKDFNDKMFMKNKIYSSRLQR